jgi:branched-chain amino acid transport system ATP-binding protein
MTTVLETRGLVKCFGRFVAANDVNLRVRAGARHALIGPNGAGKTTLINLLTGFLEPTAGDVMFEGEVVTRLPQHRRVQRGLVRTFQINRLFADLTVLESVLIAVNERLGLGAHFWRPIGAFSQAVEEAAAVLADLHLLEAAHMKTRNLPYGKRRLVEIALALAARPRVLLLDEPAAGVPAGESRELFETIARLPTDVTVLLIEHDMDLVFRFADRISVLVNGSVLADGEPEAIARDPRVKEVYLGETVGG